MTRTPNTARPHRAAERVLVITSTFPQYPDDPRGAFLRAHWEAAAAAGACVRVLVPRTRWAGDAPGGRIEIRRFRYAPRRIATLTGRFGILENVREAPWRAALVPPLMAAGARAIDREIDAFAPDRVVAHMWLPFGLVAAHRARVRGLAFEVYGHGTDVDVVLALPEPIRRRMLDLLAAAEVLHLPSAEKARRVRNAAARDLPLRVEPMVHCVPEPPDAASPEPRSGILFLGRLIPQKGVDVLLEAAARLARPVRVDVAGDGPLRRRLERQARRLGVDVVFHGYVQGARKLRLLRRAAVVCVPSRPSWGRLGEGAPLVVREALAHGAKVVASDLGGIPELCSGDPRAVLVPPGDPAALARALAGQLGLGPTAWQSSDVAAVPGAPVPGTGG
ncbi:MAG: glycosyltransferase [Deltaproteobacteria bacterium]|nr:MAG: glycosyltransferase [Deltaproteobacteria bacterium]